MLRATGLCWPLAALLWLPGWNLVHAQADSALPTASVAPCGVLILVDGAGGFEVSSSLIAATVAEADLPLEVHRFRWTHGYCRVLADHMHGSHMLREGQHLAEVVLEQKRRTPHAPIFLLAHSAGCGVVLVAADHLPPNTVERIILLAPAVSASRDLRPALRSTCHGIDAFYSRHDWACLGIGTWLSGTTDRCWRTGTAGRLGFRPVTCDCEDQALYEKLRQYPWSPSLSWTGHRGGHYGSYQPAFLRAFVFPLLSW